MMEITKFLNHSSQASSLYMFAPVSSVSHTVSISRAALTVTKGALMKFLLWFFDMFIWLC